MFRLRPALLAACLVLTASASAAFAALPASKAASADRTGIRWEPSFAAACARAAREGKPVLVLHLFGKLSDEFC